MANSNLPTVTATPLPAAASSVEIAISDSNSVPVHVALKVVRSPYKDEVGSYESIEGFFAGITYKVATNPEEIEAGFKPLLEPRMDISGEWKMTNLAVVGGFYCTLGKDNEIQNPTGIITPPSRQNKYGTIDIAKEPNGLLYILHLQNREGQHWQALYFDPQRDIKEGRIDNHSAISFPNGPKAPNLQLFADAGEETVGRFVFKRTTRIARRPIGRIACYTSGDINVERGKYTPALTDTKKLEIR